MVRITMTNREALIHNLIVDIEHMPNEDLAELICSQPKLVNLLCDCCGKCPGNDCDENCCENIRKWLDNNQ